MEAVPEPNETFAWMPRQDGDPRLRDDETVWWSGRKWFYAWSPTTRTLRRTSIRTNEHTLLRVFTLPSSPLGLAQRFYERTKMVHARLDRRPRRAAGPSRKWYNKKKPEVGVWNLESMDLPQMQAIYDRVFPTTPRTFRQRDTVLYRLREHFDRHSLVLTSLLPPGCGGITISSNIHVMESRLLPDRVVNQRDMRKSRFLDTDVIRVLSPVNPKIPGSMVSKRFAQYRDGMTVAEYVRLTGHRNDVTNDWDKGYIEVSRDGTPID